MYIYDNKYDKKIEITKGDTGSFTVSIKGYEGTSEDKIMFSVRDSIGGEYRMEETVALGSAITMSTADTTLPARKYLYDLVLLTADGQRITLIKPSTFEVIEGVAAD